MMYRAEKLWSPRKKEKQREGKCFVPWMREDAKVVYFSCCQMREAIVVKFLLLTVAF